MEPFSPTNFLILIQYYWRSSLSVHVDGEHPTHVHDHVAMADADANGRQTLQFPLRDGVDDGDPYGYGHGRAPYLDARGGGCDVHSVAHQALWPSSPLPDIPPIPNVPRESARQGPNHTSHPNPLDYAIRPSLFL